MFSELLSHDAGISEAFNSAHGRVLIVKGGQAEGTEFWIAFPIPPKPNHRFDALISRSLTSVKSLYRFRYKRGKGACTKIEIRIALVTWGDILSVTWA